MIKQIILENFKTYKKTTLTFCSGVNVITGEPGHGKTNILLGLNWNVNNRPLGGKIIRRSEKDAMVSVCVGEDNEEYTVVRKKDQSENSYTLIKDGEELATFTSFGTEPPKDISDVFNLSDLNVQKQLQPHFLVFDPPGQIATYVRSVTKLDEIDRATKLLVSKLRSEKSKLSDLQLDLETTNAQLSELSKIDLAKLEDMLTKSKDTLAERSKLQNEKEKLESILSSIKQLEKFRICLPDDIEEKLEKIENCCSKFNEIKEQIKKFRSCVDAVEKLEKVKINLPENTNDLLSSVDTALVKYNKLYNDVELLLDLSERVQDVNGKVSELSKQVVQFQKEENELMKNLTICPSCSSELTEKTKEFLLEGGCSNGRDRERRSS